MQAEPYGEEAFQFTRQLAMQRNVEMEVETVDRCTHPESPPLSACVAPLLCSGIWTAL